MAIDPASDIILDVARAADPQKVAVATKRLNDLSGVDAANADFAQSLGTASARLSSAATPDVSYNNPQAWTSKIPASGDKAANVKVGLESVLMKSFVDQLLPHDAAEVFGHGVAGDVWKSMLSDKIAAEVAKSGALGLDKKLFATHPMLSTHAAADMAAGAAADAGRLRALSATKKS